MKPCISFCAQGMSLMNFFYLRDHIWPAHAGDPTGNNTLLLEGVRELRTEADVAWLKKDLDSMTEEPVVYLGENALAGWLSQPFPVDLTAFMSSAPTVGLGPIIIVQSPLRYHQEGRAVTSMHACSISMCCGASVGMEESVVNGHITSVGQALCSASGKTVRVKTLGTESEAERRLRSLQEDCLNRAFHISMDRVNYKASDRGQVQEEQEEVLQELKDLQNPEASHSLQSQLHVIGLLQQVAWARTVW